MANTCESGISGPPRFHIVPMPQLAEARSRDDDWTGTNDAAARRRAQTRLNTRAYRKRKAMEKKAKALNTTHEKMISSERHVECWDVNKQSVSIMAASRVQQLYNGTGPLIPSKSSREQSNMIFPLSSDHLITLLQYNVLRALITNRSLISGIMATPLVCDEERIHVVPYPANPELIPAELLPTALQQSVPHGDWIDIFPCPRGRDRLIMAAGTFDEDDLWADCIGGLYEGFPDHEVEQRGIVAWSPPWNIAGWEVSEGFLRKWGWILQDSPGVMEATNGWRMRRGDEPLVHNGCRLEAIE